MTPIRTGPTHSASPLRAAVRAVLHAALLAALPAGVARAQASDAAAPIAAETQTGGAWTTELWAGYGNNSTLQLHLGEVGGMEIAFVAVGASRRVAGDDGAELRYTAELLPAVFVSALTLAYAAEACPSGHSCRFASGFGSTGTTSGVGVSPLGLEGRWRLGARTQLYAGARGGAAFFERDVPVEGGGRLHYFGGISGGLRIDVGRAAALRVGYEAHHLSNANTAPQNPGIDWHLWTAGLTWSRLPGARPAAP